MKRIISSAKPLATTLALMSGLWTHVPNAVDWVEIIIETRSALVALEAR